MNRVICEELRYGHTGLYKRIEMESTAQYLLYACFIVHQRIIVDLNIWDYIKSSVLTRALTDFSASLVMSVVAS